MKKLILYFGRNSCWLISQQFCKDAKGAYIPKKGFSTQLRTKESSPLPQISNEPEKWDLYASLCIERRPVISKDLTPLESKYKNYQSVLEFQLSKKSDHEKRHEGDITLLEKIKKGEIEQGTVETAQDFEDLSTAEAQKFVPMSRQTAADKSNDTKSLQRSLSSHLVLLVKQEIGEGDQKWVCPQLKRNSEGSLRMVVDKLLATSLPNLKVQVLGNAPWGFYKYKYSKQIRAAKAQEEGSIGAKIFFYKASYISGNLSLPGKDKTSSSAKGTTKSQDNAIKINDFVWVARAELKEKLIVPKYYESVSQFLIDED